MRLYLIPVGALLFSAAALAQTSTTLPANITADRGAVMQSKSALDGALLQLRTDEQAANAAALPADRTAIRIARIQFAEAFGTLTVEAGAYLQPDRDSLLKALTQLKTDEVAANTAAVAVDKVAVAGAEQQLKQNRLAVFDGLNAGMHEWHRGDRSGHGR